MQHRVRAVHVVHSFRQIHSWWGRKKGTICTCLTLNNSGWRLPWILFAPWPLLCSLGRLRSQGYSGIVGRQSLSRILKWKWSHSVVSDSVTPWTVAYHGIFQARVLAWVTMSFSRGSSDPGIEPGAPALQTLYHLSHTYHQSEPTASACLLCVWCSRWQWKGQGRRPSAGLWRIGLVNFEYRHLPSWKKENCVTELKTIKWKAAVPRTTLRSSS